MSSGIGRRAFIASGAAALALGPAGCQSRSCVGHSLPDWRQGELDIHFIHTGVGEQTFFIFPDGTTMLLDCGDTHHEKYMKDVPPRPDGSRYGGEWVSRYIRRVVPFGRREIDYAMVSHWHGDHTGDLAFGGRRTHDGRVVCGIPLVAEDFFFRHYFDHQYPKIGEHALDPDPGALRLMREWIPHAVARGMRPHRLEVGANDQIRLLHDASAFPQFDVRNIAANGVVWDGAGGVVDAAAAHVRRTGRDAIHENRLSSAIRIRYGRFSFYSGGDNELTMVGSDGREMDWEGMIGRATGPVDVCKTNHHAGVFGMRHEFVREVRAQVYLSSVWQAGMVDHKSLSSMCSRELYSGDRIVCFGDIADIRRGVADAYGDDIMPPGHVVVRAAPGGDTFRVFSLSTKDENMTVLSDRHFVSKTPKS